MNSSIRSQQRHDEESLARVQLVTIHKAKNNQLADAFREAQAWSEDQFQQWSKIQSEKEDDNLALQVYRRQDDATLRQLSFDLQK